MHDHQSASRTNNSHLDSGALRVGSADALPGKTKAEDATGQKCTNTVPQRRQHLVSGFRHWRCEDSIHTLVLQFFALLRDVDESVIPGLIPNWLTHFEILSLMCGGFHEKNPPCRKSSISL